MKRFVFFLAFVFLILFSYITISPAVDLQSAGSKRVTVKSEIQRGHEAVFSAAQSVDNMDLLAQTDIIFRVFAFNKQNNTDSPGFILGANFGAWDHLSMMLDLLKDKPFVRKSDYDLVNKFALDYFKTFRQLQRQMKISDDQFMQIIGFKKPLMDKIYKWDYQTGKRPK